MIVGIMQPYFFPYLGYFQLIAASDVFVLHDDVQYIKGGWVNRNRILRDGEPAWITLPVGKGASHLPINRRSYQIESWVVGRLLRRIEGAYRKARHFDALFPFVSELLTFADPNVAAFNANLLKRMSARLGIATRLVSSSAIDKADGLTGQDRVIDLCRRLGATHYINPIGGTRLYASERFEAELMNLSFLQPAVPAYRQFEPPFVPDLSIIDAMMFNDDQQLAELLRGCRLLPAGSVCAEGLSSGPLR